MTDNAVTVGGILGELAGTSLRNTYRRPYGCRFCAGWTNGDYETCHTCGFQYGLRDQPNVAGFVIYGADGTTAGTTMYGYKYENPTSKHTAVVRLLLAHGLDHSQCAAQLAGLEITHWTTIPSTKGRAHHPLRGFMTQQAPRRLIEHPLRATGVVAARRRVQEDLFDAASLPPLSHVLVIDDTWASGNKALSAVRTLRARGADRVTVLCLARWLDFDFIREPLAVDEPTGLHIPLRRQHSFDPAVCPYGLTHP